MAGSAVTGDRESANRSSGHRRLMVGLVVLLGVGFATWNLLTVVLGVIIPWPSGRGRSAAGES